MLPPPSSGSPGGGDAAHQYSNTRKYSLLILFCLAQFLDTFNISALFSAIPTLQKSLDLSLADSTWLISAFNLTFASFLLVSGRISDVYSPKWAFIGGIFALAVISLGAGFLNEKIPLIVLRALCGIAGSMTIPSALSLIVTLFPKPVEQSRAIGAFGGCGAIGNVLGLVIGGVFVEFASWHWVFWFVTVVGLPIAGVCIFLIPAQHKRSSVEGLSRYERFKTLDLFGVSILTAALVLFIFAVTSGATVGWRTVMVLVPLFIAVLLFVAFFLYEMHIPVERAAVPPHTWFYPNFSVLFGAALLPFFWWTTISTIFVTLWQTVYHRSAISSAIHIIPSSVMAFLISFTGPLAHRISPKWLILFGQLLLIIASILLTFADGEDKYWSLDFPAFVLGSSGAQLTFTHTNVAIFRATPPSVAGTVGALFNGGLQLGSAVGIAAVASIQSSVAARKGPDSYAGRRAAYWFVVAAIATEAIAIAFFYRVRAERKEGQEELAEGAKDEESQETLHEGAAKTEKAAVGGRGEKAEGFSEVREVRRHSTHA
ncbi:MFS general substrate transporter [Artomyces pyxidatus]|uniref:MFS general substrate transporter n=1 Tax=Artomyces pyxidatus TaxID=48021 RepID=A0ACB8T861_9AGAM|nr:MFS general substrate transporter [Artomyces pyxidatus]